MFVFPPPMPTLKGGGFKRDFMKYKLGQELTIQLEGMLENVKIKFTKSVVIGAAFARSYNQESNFEVEYQLLEYIGHTEWQKFIKEKDLQKIEVKYDSGV